MSLVGFKATNHPQQTGKRGAKDATDDRGTDQAFFDEMHQRFAFSLDAAAALHNAKCHEWFDLNDDGLAQPWLKSSGGPGRVWCNPPYSNIGAWVTKAWEEWENGHVEVIVMLLPANRTEQGWWQNSVEPHLRDPEQRCFRVEFLRGRMRFDRPGAVIGPKGDRPPFGCCLLIWEAR